MNTFFTRFSNFIEENGLLKSNNLIIAFSGGKDSVTLFHLLQKLKESRNFNLSGAYLNHNLREDSQKEELWVKEFFNNHKTPLNIKSIDIRKILKNSGGNLENIASQQRYNFFEHLNSEKEAIVVTAHTKSDITETFLIKLLRGSGLQGLTTIHPQKNGYIERPLLEFTSEEIKGFLKNKSLKYYQDSSNLTRNFLRNRIRMDLVPALKEINPSIDEAFSKTSKILRDELNYFSSLAKQFLKRNLIAGKILEKDVLNREPVALRRHILREYVRTLKGNLLNISYENIEAILNGSNETSIPGITLSMEGRFISPLGIVISQYKKSLQKNETIFIKEIGAKIETSLTDRILKDPSNRSVTLPLSKISFPLEVRYPLKEDKYQKINTTFQQKVFEMLRSNGIPPQLRYLSPVILTGNIPIWAFRCPVSSEFFIKPEDSPPFLKIDIEYMSCN